MGVQAPEVFCMALKVFLSIEACTLYKNLYSPQTIRHTPKDSPAPRNAAYMITPFNLISPTRPPYSPTNFPNLILHPSHVFSLGLTSR